MGLSGELWLDWPFLVLQTFFGGGWLLSALGLFGGIFLLKRGIAAGRVSLALTVVCPIACMLFFSFMTPSGHSGMSISAIDRMNWTLLVSLAVGAVHALSVVLLDRETDAASAVADASVKRDRP